MDQDTNKDMPANVKDCGCKAGADGGMCEFCVVGKHSQCVKHNCDEPDTDMPADGDKA